MDALAALRLQIEWGADEALADAPVDRLGSKPPERPPSPEPPSATPAPATRVTRSIAPAPRPRTPKCSMH